MFVVLIEDILKRKISSHPRLKHYLRSLPLKTGFGVFFCTSICSRFFCISICFSLISFFLTNRSFLACSRLSNSSSFLLFFVVVDEYRCEQNDRISRDLRSLDKSIYGTKRLCRMFIITAGFNSFLPREVYTIIIRNG
jgi:hypothetical protein